MDSASVKDDLLVDAVRRLAGFEALPGGDAGLVHVQLVHAHAADVVAVAAVAAKADAAGVAHPQRGQLFAFFAFGGEDAVVVAVVAAKREELLA